MVAAWGTGKTMWVCCLKPVLQCQKYPGNQWLIVRKEQTRLEDSTIPDFEKYTGLKVDSKHNVRIRGDGWTDDMPDSEIMFRHGKQIDMVEVLQNMNLGGFSIEQAEEFATDREFQMLRGRLRRADVEHFGCISANAKGHNWIWRIWKKKDLPTPTDSEVKELVMESGLTEEVIRAAFDPACYALFEANTYANKSNLSADFIRDLVRMKTESPAHYNRLILNSWEELDEKDNVIPFSAIQQAVGRFMQPLRTKRLVSVEPAEFGDDETVIYGLESGKIVKSDIYVKKELAETADRVFDVVYAVGAKHIVVDPIGVGAGLRSFLKKRGERESIQIISADNREKASDPKTYFNRRAEIWFSARARFMDKTVSIPEDDPMLQEELTAIGYDIQADKTRKIHKKDKIKKADYLGHSPSRAEALVNGLWAEDQIAYDVVSVSSDDRESHQTDVAESYIVDSVL